MNLGPYAFYIVGAYAATALIVLGLIAWVVLDHRSQKRQLKQIDRPRGGKRAQRPATVTASEQVPA